MYNLLFNGYHTTGDIIETSCLDSCAAKSVGIGILFQEYTDRFVGKHICQSVTTEHEDVARNDVIRHLYHVDIGRDTSSTDSVGDDILSFFSYDHVTQRVICRQLDQLVVTETVQPAVATVHGVEVVVVIGEAYQGCSHTLELFIGTAFGGNVIIDGFQPSHDGLIEVASRQTGRNVIEEILEIMENVVAGNVATIMASHTVGYRYYQTIVIV